MTWHPHIWLWLWFFIGMAVYMLKRAYYLVTGPNPVAMTYKEFFQKCWIPLFVRFAVDSGLYWVTFYPDIFDALVARFGWQLHSAVPQYAVVAFFIGLGVDSIVDFAVTKIPYVKDWLPQMPPPLKPPSGSGQP
jgi:hypothetical protein